MTDKAKMTLPSDGNASGRTFGAEELQLLQQVLESGTLNCTHGTVVKQLEQELMDGYGVSFARCVTSGTAAVHAAVAAVDPEPGDEVISTPITDMGAITPIIYQTAIPVFADVDPLTYNVTAETIEACITRRTKAVIVTHLFGNCCDMDPILELCKAKNLPCIEDAAQAYGTEYKGRRAGTMGDIGCYSLQQGKHMTSGEGGFVLTSDEAHARRMKLFIDKAWGYGDPRPDHYFLAPNYRMTELQGAVALAQLRKLPDNLQQRVAMVQRLNAAIADVPGVYAPAITEGSNHTYWRYALRVDEAEIPGGVDAFGAAMKAAGVFCGPRYIQKPAFECQVLRDHVTFGDSKFPFEGPHRADDPPVVYDRANTPGTVEALAAVVVLPVNERYTEEHIDHVAGTIRTVVAQLKG